MYLAAGLACLGQPFPAAGVAKHTGDIEIDGRSGVVVKGETKHTQCVVVKVAIKNKQPFLYQYSFEGKTVLIPEPGLQGLSQIFGATLALLETLPPSTPAAVGGGAESSRVVARPKCTTSNEIEAVSTAFFGRLRSFRDALKKLIDVHIAGKGVVDSKWKTLQDFSSTETMLETAASAVLAEETDMKSRITEARRLGNAIDAVVGLATAVVALTDPKKVAGSLTDDRSCTEAFSEVDPIG